MQRHSLERQIVDVACSPKQPREEGGRDHRGSSTLVVHGRLARESQLVVARIGYAPAILGPTTVR